MQPDGTEIDQLRRTAEVCFLRGDYLDAEAAWRRMLEASPDDERAKRGLRLCNQLVEQQFAFAEARAAEVPPVPADPGIQAEIAEELRQLEPLGEAIDDLSSMEFSPTMAEGDAGLSAPLAAGAAESMASGEMLPAVESGAGLDSQMELPAFGEQDMPLPDTPSYPVSHLAPDVDDDTAQAAGRAAANEVQRRVHELLAEATQAYEAGEPERALGVLRRILILDEKCYAAQVLMARVEGKEPPPPPAEPSLPLAGEGIPLAGDGELSAGLEGEDLLGDIDLGDLPPADVGAPDGPPPLGDPAALGGPPPLEGVPSIEGPPPMDDVPMLGDAGAMDDGLGDALDDADADADAEAEAEAERHAALARAEQRLANTRASTSSSGGKLKWIGIAAAGVVVLAVGGWFAMSAMGGSAEAVDPADDPLAAARARKAEREAAAQAAAAAAAAEQAATEAENAIVADETEIAAWMAQAVQAHDRGELAEAAALYNRVLRARPGDAEATASLSDVVAELREVQKLNAARDAAFESFRAGDFREALRGFYRLPADNGVDYTPYIAAGWYNLGLQSLQRGDCSGAGDSFEEFRQTVGDAAYSNEAWLIAQSCDDNIGTRAFRRSVGALELMQLQ